MTSRPRSVRPCASFKTTREKSAPSTKNLLSDMPRECLVIYELINTGVQEPRIERVETLRDRQRRHEVAPDISHQALDLALVIALARSAKAVGEQVMALEFREHLRAQPLSALHNLGHREPGIVV